LLLGKKGSLYGTTNQGGAYGEGTVFKVTPPTKKGHPWIETVLYSFGSQSGDGFNPDAGLVMDKLSNLYGTTFYGGNLGCNSGYGCGTVFKVTP
jgi:uncharacterized repeat protein (TIGR03803 family)